LHGDAPTHRALETKNKLSYLKKTIESSPFLSDAEVIAAAETLLDGKPSAFFLSGLQTLEQRAKKCIELRGEYVE